MVSGYLNPAAEAKLYPNTAAFRKQFSPPYSPWEFKGNHTYSKAEVDAAKVRFLQANQRGTIPSHRDAEIMAHLPTSEWGKISMATAQGYYGDPSPQGFAQAFGRKPGGISKDVADADLSKIYGANGELVPSSPSNTIAQLANLSAAHSGTNNTVAPFTSGSDPHTDGDPSLPGGGSVPMSRAEARSGHGISGGHPKNNNGFIASGDNGDAQVPGLPPVTGNESSAAKPAGGNNDVADNSADTFQPANGGGDNPPAGESARSAESLSLDNLADAADPPENFEAANGNGDNPPAGESARSVDSLSLDKTTTADNTASDDFNPATKLGDNPPQGETPRSTDSLSIKSMAANTSPT